MLKYLTSMIITIFLLQQCANRTNEGFQDTSIPLNKYTDIQKWRLIGP